MNDNKKAFLENYILSSPQKITTYFDYENHFINNNDIEIVTKEIAIGEFCEFYTPWHQKNGIMNGKIEEVLRDLEYKTIKVKDALNYEDKKIEVEMKQQSLISTLCDLHPIPIATDIGIDKTLVLDGNKTIIALTRNKENCKKKIEVIEIQGTELNNLIIDFNIIAR